MKRAADALAKLNWGKRTCTVSLLCAATAILLPAQTFTTLHSFDGTDGDGYTSALVQGTDGNFYGTTFSGGANGDFGTVFKITPSGTLTTLYSFCSQTNCTDGALPGAGLVQANDGDFYGTTSSGGGNGPYGGWGTVFKITPGGTLTTLYAFCSQSDAQNACTDGIGPNGLIQATDGNLYGTTRYRGANGNYGTVFKITPGGTLTTIYNFCSRGPYCADGSRPASELVQGSEGDFYGTTYDGGVYTLDGGGGTVFKITPSGTLTTLYSFCSQIVAGQCPDGFVPQTGLVQAANGDLYGTMGGGGANLRGYVFKITPTGTLTPLYSFCSQTNCADGAGPLAGLVLANDGNFYGTTSSGGGYDDADYFPDGGGTIFKITPSGTLTTLYSFCAQSGCADGGNPQAPLIQATNGDFYGMTYSGGTDDTCNDGCGTIFALSVGLVPSVPAVNAGGVLNSASYTTQGVAPGSIVSIFGTNLTASTASANAIPLPTTLSDVTSVTFNGIPAGLYFVSQNQINAQLPFNVLPSNQGGTVNIAVTRSSGTSAAQTVSLVPASPGIFTTTANGLGQAFAYDNTTGSVAAPAGVAIGSLATAPISVSSGHALIIACTGLGSVNPSIDNYVAASDGMLRYTVLTPTVLIGGVAAMPIYSVLSPQFVSEYQIGVTPSANTPTGDAVPIQIGIGGVTTTNQVTIAVAP